MTRAKNFLAIVHPLRFFIRQQHRLGDRHVFTPRARFIPDAILDRFERVAPAERAVTARAAGARRATHRRRRAPARDLGDASLIFSCHGRIGRRASASGGQVRRLLPGAQGAFVEREDLLAQIALALLSREHVLMTGPPGTAKSQLAAPRARPHRRRGRPGSPACSRGSSPRARCRPTSSARSTSRRSWRRGAPSTSPTKACWARCTPSSTRCSTGATCCFARRSTCCRSAS